MLTELAAKEGVLWTNVAEPEPEELAEFVRLSGLVPDDAEFVVQDHHRPDIITRPQYVLILIHVPTFDRQTRVTSGVPLYFVITATHLWTLHHGPLVVLEKLLRDYDDVPEKRAEYFREGSLLLALHVISVMYASAARKLERLKKHVDIAEDAVFLGNERKMVEEVFLLVRDVLDFRQIMLPQTTLFAEVPSHSLIRLEDAPQWHRLHTQVQKVWEMLQGLFESTKQLASTNSSLLQHKENELLRFLTYYSIISIPIILILEPFINDGLDTDFERSLYWGGLGALALTLLFIIARFRGKRVL